MKITIVTNPAGCAHCNQVKETIEKIKSDYKNLEINEVLTSTDEGVRLVQEHNIMASPGIIIDGKFAFQGGASEAQLRKKLDEYKN